MWLGLSPATWQGWLLGCPILAFRPLACHCMGRQALWLHAPGHCKQMLSRADLDSHDCLLCPSSKPHAGRRAGAGQGKGVFWSSMPMPAHPPALGCTLGARRPTQGEWGPHFPSPHCPSPPSLGKLLPTPRVSPSNMQGSGRQCRNLSSSQQPTS